MFNENLKTLRKQKGLSQETLAAQLHVSRQTISKWEKGISVPDVDLLFKLADILEVSVSELLGQKLDGESPGPEVAEQLSQIAEQLTIKNRRARRIWKVIIGIVIALAVLTTAIFALAYPISLTIVSPPNNGNSDESSAPDLLQEVDNTVVLEPPALSVICGESSIDALLGGYSWTIINSDETATTTIADSSAHPSAYKDSLSPPVETTETTATLRFTEDPDTILSVQCWSDELLDEDTTSSEEVAVDGNVIELKAGGYIYEIAAEWDTEKGYGGTARYVIYLERVG